MNDIYEFAQAANTTIDPFEARLAAIQIAALPFMLGLVLIGLFVEWTNRRALRRGERRAH